MLEKRVLSIFLLLLVWATSYAVNAQLTQAPTAQQLEQFKRLPAAQQRALAQQLGIDYSTIQAYLSGSLSNTRSGIDSTESTIFPRGTEFDEMGNPVNYSDPINKYLELEERELKPFGYELFSGSPSTFAPTTDAPVPANYLLGVGDTLVLQTFGKENALHQLQIDREGKLTIPSMRPISVAGLTYTEAKQYVAEQIKQNMLGVESHISMGELRTMRIFVLGEAHKPGAYTVSSLTSMTHALFLSGGVNEIASLRNIQLKRAGKIVSTLDLYDLLINGDTSHDKWLRPGDVVFVPTVENTVTVQGKVKREAIYELKDDTTFADVIDLAGGFTRDAYDGILNVKRLKNGALTRLSVGPAQHQMRAQDGDVIEVGGVTDRVSEAVTLLGAVARPGGYQWFSGMTLLDLIPSRDSALLTETDLTYGLVLRDYQTGENLEILQFSPSAVFADGSTQIELQSSDLVVLFSLRETEQLGMESIYDLAKTKEQLSQKEKEDWRKRIEQKLFWQQIGLDASDEEQNLRRTSEDNTDLTEDLPLIKLTELEKESLLALLDVTEYSRKRLLTPILSQLKRHASFNNPLKVVEVSGSVQYPGLYPLPKNGTLDDLLRAAGGLSESAFAFQSEVTRYSTDDDGHMTVENIAFRPVDVVNKKNNFELKSRDRVNIYQNPEWQEELVVELKGEVVFPGAYTIRRGETLKEVLSRAGGLTEYANPNASIFLRESLKAKESENLKKLTEELRKEIASEGLRNSSGASSLVSYSEVQKLLRDLTDVTAVGRLVINLPAILADNSGYELPLESGDTLVVPAYNKTVNVIGEVYVPTSHLYEEGLEFQDYIQLSGGFREFAADNKAYIIKANGSVMIPNKDSGYWYQKENNKVFISPGDTVVVPYDSSHIDNLTLWTSATQIAYQLAVTIAALGSI